MSRPNTCIKDENGNDVWVVRSSVVIPVVIKYDDKSGDFYALLEKRGAAVSHSGEWCCPCGFIDWDESLEEACQREVMEETGLELSLDEIQFFKVETDKNSRSQSIDHWYFCFVGNDKDFMMSKVKTKDEILELRWLKVAHANIGNPLLKLPTTLDIFKKSIYDGFGKWAFKTHHKKIIDMLSYFFSNQWVINIIDK